MPATNTDSSRISSDDRAACAAATPATTPTAGRTREKLSWRARVICGLRAMSTNPPIITIDHDQGPLDHLAEIGIDIEENQIRRDQGQHECRHHRPDHSAASAGQTDAADDDRGQSAERVIDPGERRPDSGGHGQAQAADRTEQAGEDVGGKARAIDVDAAAESRDAIAADRVELQSRAWICAAESRSRRPPPRAKPAHWATKA